MFNLRRLLYILVFLVFLTGCGGTSASNFSTTTPRPGSASIPSATCQPPSLDNCYTESQMKDYLDNVAIPDVVEFIQYIYAQMPLPYYMYIPEGRTFNSKCAQVGEMAYEFCILDDTVYIGQKQEWVFYHDYGAIAPVFAISHEFGHHIQVVARVPQPRNSQESVNHENQADCISGAWVLWADLVAHKVEYPKDLRNIDTLLVAMASAEGPNRDHGTASERVRSFELGHSSGLSACNSYYPDHPILI